MTLKLNEDIPLVETYFCFFFFLEVLSRDLHASRLWTEYIFYDSSSTFNEFDNLTLQTGSGVIRWLDDSSVYYTKVLYLADTVQLIDCDVVIV